LIIGESPLKDLYRRGLWGPGRRVLEALPAPWEMVAVRAAGRSAAAVVGRRRIIRENLARALPDLLPARLDELTRDAFAAHFSNQYASFSFDKCTADTWGRYLAIKGLEHLEAAHAQGRGVVLTHPHMGPAQLPLLVLGRLGWPMHQVGGGRVALVEL